MAQTSRLPQRSSNTTVYRDSTSIMVTLHKTTVFIKSAKRITLNTGGWCSVTTQTRINQACNELDMPFCVTRSKGQMYVCPRNDAMAAHFELQGHHANAKGLIPFTLIIFEVP